MMSCKKRYIFGAFARRMMAYLLLLSLLTISILSIMFYNQETRRTFTSVEDDIVKTISNFSQQINSTFTAIQNVYANLLRDQELFTLFSTYGKKTISNYTANEIVSQAISNQTMYVPQVLSVQFMTSRLVFSENNTNLSSIYNYTKSSIFKTVFESRTRYTWMPTYDYTQAFEHKMLQSKEIPLRNRYIISLIGLYEPLFFSREANAIQRLSKKTERPVLVINMCQSVLENYLIKAQQTGWGEYLIIDDTGKILSGADKSLLLTRVDPVLMTNIGESPIGRFSYVSNGHLMRVYYSTLSTGWRLLAQVPEGVIRTEIMRGISSSFMISAILVLVLCMLLGYFLSRNMSKPLNRLLMEVSQTGQARFEANSRGMNNEFNTLVEIYHDMNGQLELLIEEKYAEMIRQKETQLLALKYQTNPHFLYNALTIIYLCSQRENSLNTSRLLLSLSKMMQYVVRDQRDIVSLADELENVRQYMSLIDIGYEGTIQWEYEVDDELLNQAVPKLCLQPLVENSVMHGLHGRMDGRIWISAGTDGSTIRLCVRDNGQGLPNTFSMNQHKGGERTSIGLHNVHMRIILLFGENYGISTENSSAGACIVFHLPRKNVPGI